MTLLERTETYVSKRGRLPRRSFLGRTVQICAALAGLAAGVVPLDQALADCGGYQSGQNPCPGGPHNVECCCLLYPSPPYNFCNSDYYSRQCPASKQGCSGSGQPWEWVCNQNINGRLCAFVCGECYCSCCSYAYPLCSPGCACIPGAPTLEDKLLSMQSIRRAAIVGR
jgi:hypothetical protein